MKKFIQVGFLCGAFLFLTGFKGVMDVQEPIDFNARKGLKNIGQGEYDVSLSRRSKNLLRLEVSVEDKRNNSVVDIKFPKNKNLDVLDGFFVLSPEESGQKYWLEGHYAEESTEGRKRWGERSCSRQFEERYCWIDNRGFRRCQSRWVSRRGYQDISYYDVETLREIILEFKKDEMAAASAALSAESRGVRRVVSEEGPCRVY